MIRSLGWEGIFSSKGVIEPLGSKENGRLGARIMGPFQHGLDIFRPFLRENTYVKKKKKPRERYCKGAAIFDRRCLLIGEGDREI